MNASIYTSLCYIFVFLHFYSCDFLCACAGSSLEVKIETDSNDTVEIKTEADHNDITEDLRDDRPSIGKFI